MGVFTRIFDQLLNNYVFNAFYVISSDMKTSISDLSIKTFLEQTGNVSKAIGGGSVAIVAAAQGTALIRMCLSIAFSNEEQHREEAKIQQIVSRLAQCEDQFLTLAREDAEAYSAFTEIQQESGSFTDMQRQQAKRTVEVPQSVMRRIDKVLRLVCDSEIVMPEMLKGDMSTALELLRTAFRNAHRNIQQNKKRLNKISISTDKLDESDAIEQSLRESFEQVEYDLSC